MTLITTDADDVKSSPDQASNTQEWSSGFDAGYTAGAEFYRDQILEWKKLLDPHTLHINLLRGFPAKLSEEQLLHLLGSEHPLILGGKRMANLEAALAESERNLANMNKV